MSEAISDERLAELRQMVADDMQAPLGEWASAPGHVGELLAEVERLRAAVGRVIALHQDAGESQGYTESGYGEIEHCCGTCGTFGEYGQPWPCDTIRALEGDVA